MLERIGARDRARRSITRLRSLVGPLAALVVVGLAFSACGGAGSAATSTTSTTSTSTTTTTTTTTTTLPRPTRVHHSGAYPGGFSYGEVSRLPVVPVPDGQSTAPAAPTGSPAQAGAIFLAYHQVGSGPDLVLIAGQRASMSWWDPQLIENLAQHYTVTFFDLPGIGYSQPDPRATSIAALADLTAGLIDELGLSAPTVLGWGMGGEVALALAERHPGIAGRLALVDTSAGGPTSVSPSPAVQRLLADPNATMTQLARLLFPTPAAQTTWLEALSQMAPDDVTANAIRNQAAIQSAYFATDRAVATGLATITVPALVIDSSHDAVIPPANAAVLSEGLAHARQVVLKGAGYGGIFSHEDTVIAALERFTG